MSRAPSTFRKRDIVTALQAAAAVGLRVSRVEIGKDGKIVLVTTGESSACPDKVNEWDTVLANGTD